MQLQIDITSQLLALCSQLITKLNALMSVQYGKLIPLILEVLDNDFNIFL